MAGATGARTSTPNGNMLASGEADVFSRASGSEVGLAPTQLAPAGSTLPHENMQPVLAVNFIIALEGIFPSRNWPSPCPNLSLARSPSAASISPRAAGRNAMAS
jgi:hypothetical protein